MNRKAPLRATRELPLAKPADSSSNTSTQAREHGDDEQNVTTPLKTKPQLKMLKNKKKKLIGDCQKALPLPQKLIRPQSGTLRPVSQKQAFCVLKPIRKDAFYTNEYQIKTKINLIISYDNRQHDLKDICQTASIFDVITLFSVQTNIPTTGKRVVIRNKEYDEIQQKQTTVIQLRLSDGQTIFLFDKLAFRETEIDKNKADHTMKHLDNSIVNGMWRICEEKLKLTDVYTSGRGVAYVNYKGFHTLINFENPDENSDYDMVE